VADSFREKSTVGWWLISQTNRAVTYPRGTVAPVTAVGHNGKGPVCFQKFVIFCLNSDGGKLYMKIVAFDEIYDFVVQNFSV
jgi:hypothetical protein